MSSFPEKEIGNPEQLYRAIKPLKFLWNYKLNRPTSAIFHDKNGVSVDRLGDKSEDQLLADYSQRFKEDSGVLRITAGKCREIQTHPVPKPSKSNVNHAEIHDSQSQVLIASEKRDLLARSVEIMKIPDIQD